MTTENEYAGFGIRFAARIVDSITIFVIFIVIAILLFVLGPMMGPSKFETMLPFIAFYFLLPRSYSTILHALYGQTLGKKVLGLRVIKTDGSTKIGWTTAVLREIGDIISALPVFLGYIWIIIDKNKQGWHDKIANTYVVKEREPGEMSPSKKK